jgi:septal ring factor EnvC (AmiA/AmiB activator)
LSNHQRKTRELQNRLDIITNLERDLRDLIELSRGIAERRNKLGEAERTKASTIARLDQKKIDLTSLDAKLAVSRLQLGRGI